MFWKFLIAYQSVFASILTLITTLVITHILRNKGKIDFEFLEVDYREDLELYFELIIYNNSETPKSIYDLHIEYIGNTQILDAHIRNRETLTTSDKNMILLEEF